jgi:hypothetical protein
MATTARSLSLALLLFGLVHTCSALIAQTNRKPLPKRTSKPEAAMSEPSRDRKQQALELLPLLAERIDTLKSPVWKVRLNGFLAELLAAHNPEAARALFQQSLESLESIPVRRPRDTSFSAEAIHSVELNSLRSEVLMRAAVADPPSADAILERLGSSASTDSGSPARLSRRKEQIVGQVGMALAQEHPEMAAQWIEKSVQTGFTVWTHLALETLRRQNPQLADATFSSALSRLESDPAANLQSVSALGSYLFPGTAPTMFGTSAKQDEDDYEIGFDLHSMSLEGRNRPAGDSDPELVSRYLNLAYERYVASLSELSSGPVTAENPALQGVLESLPMAAMLRPLLAKHLPEKAASLQARLNELSRYFANEDGTTLEKTLDFLASIGDPEKMAHWEAATSPENQDFRNHARAMTAIRQGRTADATAIMEKVRNEELRRSFHTAVVSSQVKEAMEQGQLDSAAAQARTLSEPSRQVSFLIQIAEQHTKRKEPEPALLCLAEAGQLLDKLEVHSRLSFALDIVGKMTALDSERAYHSAARLVEEINRAGASKTGPSYFREGPDLAVASNFLGSRSFALLAEADFDATLALAQSIARPETSIAAQLAVCQGVLTGKAKGQPASR